jgi:hypothetical protein
MTDTPVASHPRIVQLTAPYEVEERIVAELELLGIRYLSRQTSEQATHVRAPELLLADVVRQPSARVRAAIIAILLAHPEFSNAIPAALERCDPAEQVTLCMFYTAAVLLQQTYSDRLQPALGSRWRVLPDLFSSEIGLSPFGTPGQRLIRLGQKHRQKTRMAVNWAGAYENVAQRLLRSWDLEARWKR